MHLTTFDVIAATIVGVLSVARTARLLVHDIFPPVVRLRIWWDSHTKRGSWGELLHCQFCLTPWMAPVMLAWFWYSDAHWTWWVINGCWGLSYLAAMTVSYDQPTDPVVINNPDNG